MSSVSMWKDPLYLETSAIILAFLTVLGVAFFFFRKKNPPMIKAWASLKSWFFIAPMILVVLALPSPWPLIFLTLISVNSSKIFFQMTGMYHRSWFVWMTYIFSFLLGYLSYQNASEFYNVMPMIFLGALSCIPLIRNSANHMIQYMALSLMAFIFFGWSFLHMGRLLAFEGGVLIVLYLYLLSEFSDNASLAVSRLFGRIRPFPKISMRVSLEGVVASIILSLLLAWGLRHLLPDRSEQFWIAAGLVAAVFGRFGDLILSVIRRDLGIKDTGVFIIGRGDLLSRVNKLIFVGPMYYYIYLYLQQASS